MLETWALPPQMQQVLKGKLDEFKRKNHKDTPAKRAHREGAGETDGTGTDASNQQQSSNIMEIEGEKDKADKDKAAETERTKELQSKAREKLKQGKITKRTAKRPAPKAKGKAIWLLESPTKQAKKLLIQWEV